MSFSRILPLSVGDNHQPQMYIPYINIKYVDRLALNPEGLFITLFILNYHMVVSNHI